MSKMFSLEDLHLLGSKRKDTTKRKRTLQSREFWKIKEESGCVDCGAMYPHWMLDFDHRPGHEKVGSPTQLMRTNSYEKAMAEVRKCDVVCANCHRIRTYIRNQSGYKNL